MKMQICSKGLRRKRGQVWVETVLYTLIGLALMGLVLAFVMPEINKSKDRLLVEQTITSLSKLDEKIMVVSEVPGNVRTLDFMMKKGDFYINGSDDSLMIILSGLNGAFSEAGAEINYGGRISILTQENEDKYDVVLRLLYVNDITHKGKDELKMFSAASVPYSFSIENLGDINGDGRFVISMYDTSA